MKYLTFSKLINHYNKSSLRRKIFSVIAQSIINLPPAGKFYSAQLIIYCAKFFLGLLKVGIVLFLKKKILKK